MERSYLYKSSIVIKIALGVGLLLIAFVTCLFFNQMQNMGKTVQSMSVSTHKVYELEKILSILRRNDATVKSYIILQDKKYLENRYFSRDYLNPNIAKLRNLVKDNSTPSVDSLTSLINIRFELLEKALKAANEKGFVVDQDLRQILVQGDVVSDNLREYIYSYLQKELANLDQYEIDHRYEVESSIINSFLLVSIALLILLVSLYRINSDLTSLKKLNDDLKFINLTFYNAEKVAGISHWKYNLKHKTFFFSDNFFIMLGINNQIFEPTVSSLLQFVHEHDRSIVLETVRSSFSKLAASNSVFRVVLSDESIRYIKAVGSFGQNSIGETVSMGVLYDITEQVQSNKILEESNMHLKEVNAELESFNNIVSHDLQEPVRKIQIFISRIEGEADLGGKMSQEYFKRIKISARRMQNLLIDLVNYSRAIKEDKAFEFVDIKAIVNDVLEELHQDIVDKSAAISIGDLPQVNVIPFQIHQLFVNLISNALKFSKHETFPEISITSDDITNDDLEIDNNVSNENFFKITVSDNGIGFKSEYAEKIFQLFQRLEKDSDYIGTGIGLAICKKIVENHRGIIYAKGIVGEGAKFVIYFPK